MQHERLIRHSRRYRWDKQKNEGLAQVVLFTENLLELEEWNDKSKKFIRNQGDTIRLIEVIESHHPDIVNFQHEVWQVAMDEYEEEFRDYQQKQDELDSIIKNKFER